MIGYEMTRALCLERLAGIIIQEKRSHPLRVAIDGIDAAGKTTLADELAVILQASGLPVIRASLDGFHNSRRQRYRHGSDSPEGYYLDSFDYPALQAALLDPLGPGGNLHYQRGVFDFMRDEKIEALIEQAPANSILLFDGIFLMRPELNQVWDYRIFVKVSFQTALQRALQRDLSLFGSPQAVEVRYHRRYIPAQTHYLNTIHPEQLADCIVHNNNLKKPVISYFKNQ